METESFVELNLGVTPEAAISGAVLLQTEEKAFLAFNAMREQLAPRQKRTERTASTARSEGD